MDVTKSNKKATRLSVNSAILLSADLLDSDRAEARKLINLLANGGSSSHAVRMRCKSVAETTAEVAKTAAEVADTAVVKLCVCSGSL